VVCRIEMRELARTLAERIRGKLLALTCVINAQLSAVGVDQRHPE